MRRTAMATAIAALLLVAPASAQATNYVGCANKDFSQARTSYKPKSCTLLALRGTGLVLRKMTWRSWAGATALGRGTTNGMAIRVTLYGRVRFEGDTCFTKLRYRTGTGGGRLRFATCGQSTG